MELPTDPLSPTRITAKYDTGVWTPSKTVGPLSPDPGQKECSEETAMLLPAALSSSRKLNETHDIRKNLRLRYPLDERENSKEYCVEFEVLKASKACRKEEAFSSLRDGDKVCVMCEHQAQRKGLGFRCPGHGVEDRSTRWGALSAPHCHGKWIRLTSSDICPCKKGADFIFV